MRTSRRAPQPGAATIPPALVEKYDVPGPRYTSYPAVPLWDPASFSEPAFDAELARAIAETPATEGSALYVHLPFCERLCTFCGCTKRITRNHALEAPYVERLLAEWAALRERLGGRVTLGEIHLGGGTPTFFAPGRLARLVEGLLEGAALAPDARLGFEGHPGSTSAEHLRALRELGFSRLSLGVQDFDAEVQRLINRIQPLEQVRAVTEEARALGYDSINYDLVYGLPGQREAGVADTVEKVIALRPDRIAFYAYAHVPWLRGLGQRKFRDEDVPRGAAKRALFERGRALLEAGGWREIGMDHFALPEDELSRAMRDGRLHRNFMGYTTSRSRVTIGLGMSAISDCGGAFAQNEKRLEDWSQAIDARGRAHFRGHLLDEEDRRLRDHMLALSCRLETAWRPADDCDGTRERVSAALAEMVADGLVAIDDRGVRVLERGRAFLRNACMAFDARLARGPDPATPRFSRTM